jgi:DNA polymerase-3 subunit alpha
MEYDLLFERFLNPARVSMPDVDTDFEDSER